MPNLRHFCVTVYPNRYATAAGESHQLTWPELLDFCRAPDPIPPAGKDALPFWHGVELRTGGRRCNADVARVHALFLDIDRCADCARAKKAKEHCLACRTAIKDTVDAVDDWGICAAAFPSPSGKRGRGRIIIPLARPVTVAEHYVLWRIVNVRLGGMLDRQTVAPSHGYYTPAIADPSSWWLRELGDPDDLLEVDAFDLEDPEPPVRAPTAQELADFSPETRMREVQAHLKMLPPAEEGERHGALFRLAQFCRDYALSIERTRDIVHAYNLTCVPPEDHEVIEREILANLDRYRRHAVGCAITMAAQIRQDHTITLDRMLDIIGERASEELYVYGGRLCELVNGTGDRFVPVEEPRLHSLLTHYVHCYAYAPAKKDGEQGEWKRAPVPPWAAKEILAMPELRQIRTADGIVSAPSLKPDGTVLCTPGHDRDTRLIYRGEPVDLPLNPDRDDALAALERVERIFGQFPFDSPVSRSIHTAYLLTAVARSFIDGPVPIGIFDATKMQSGKSKLAQSVAIIMTGHQATSDAWPAENKMTQVLHTRCVSDGRFVLFDNVRNGSVLESHELDGALTGMKVSQRRYFSQQAWDIAFKAIVLATGNGISIGGDMRPRALYMRLVPDCDRPEERSDFEIPDLLGHVTRYRLDICRDLLTVWLAWLRAGRPGVVPPWQTVPGWTPVRQVLTWLERADPYQCRQELAARDHGQELHERLLEWIAARAGDEGMSCRELLESLRPKRFGGGGDDTDERAELWALICAETGPDPDVRKIGWVLRRRQDAPLAGAVLRRRSDSAGGRNGRWYVEVP